MAAERKGRRALGRGLDALLPTRPAVAQVDPRYGAGAVFTSPIERIVPRDDQPRQRIDPTGLDDLATTIEEHGVIQPLVVRRLGDPGPNERYEIIAGERRWRAAQRAGLKEVPIVVKDVTPAEAFEMALIENVQRQDLNPVEVAEAYQRLLDDHGYTQEEVARRVGKSRVAVTNSLRLLRLPDSVRAMLGDGRLSEGHGRALLAASDPSTMVTVAQQAVRGRLSVRRLERLLRRSKEGSSPSKDGEAAPKSPGIRDLETRLGRRLGARVSVEHRGPGGKLVVSYADLDELDRIIALLGA